MRVMRPSRREESGPDPLFAASPRRPLLTHVCYEPRERGVEGAPARREARETAGECSLWAPPVSRLHGASVPPAASP